MDHEHSLQRKPPGAPYTCSGCGELGFGSSYHCENNTNCSYVLHEVCANPEPYAFHPFFEKSYFEFHRKPPGYKTRYCDACGKDVLGFVYHCSSTDYDLHPCCLKLQHSISDDNGNVTLNLSKRVHSKCAKCKHKHVIGKVQGWSYHDGNSCYHVACFKDLILQNWRRGYFCEGDREAQLVLTRSRRARTMSKYTKIAVVIFKLIFSAIFGNPISAVFTLVEALASN